MRRQQNRGNTGKGWGPFTGRQLTTIVCVAIVAAVAIPTAAMAAVGTFTNTASAAPAVTGTNSAAAASAVGVRGSASATSAGVTRYGMAGDAAGTFGIGVKGTGTRYGVFSSGPLGVAAGKALSCTGCVGVGALSNAAGRTRAYAYVDGNGTVVTARSRNIAAGLASTALPGIYCVTVSNVAGNTIAPVVTVSDTAVTGKVWSPMVTFDPNWIGAMGACPGSSFVVFTYAATGSGGWTLANTDFTIAIP